MHRNHKNSSSNHNLPQHQKNNLPPEKQQLTTRTTLSQKRSVLNRIRERFQEKPATAEEVRQLGLNAKREQFKTQIHRAKSARPSRLDRIAGSFGGGQPAPRGRSRQQSSGFESGNWLMGGGSGPSLDFITGNNSQQRGRGRRQEESGFTGKGLSDLF